VQEKVSLIYAILNNPCEMKATLGKNAFVLRMREWVTA
jgi:hypothetical protein